jgi:hypothetical protein
VRGVATPEVELVRILEWGDRLDPSNHQEMQALTRVFPWLDESALQRLRELEPDLLDRVYIKFSGFVQEATFAVEYCDEFADFAKRALDVVPSPALIRASIKFLAVRAARQQRWYVRDVLIDLLMRIADDNMASQVVKALSELPLDIVEWNINDFALRAMPPTVREPLSRWLGEPSPT